MYMFRVINAGKSALNEDQACCEVVELRKRPADPASPSYTPTSRRRASLPTRESLDSKDDSLIQESSVSALFSSAPLLLNISFFYKGKQKSEDSHNALLNIR